MRKKLLATFLFSMMLSAGAHPALAQRTEDATTWVGVAAGAMAGGAAGSGGSMVVDKILELYGLDLTSVQDNGRWATSLMTNLNEFEKIMAYDKNIQEIFINTESTAEEGKNATQEALGKMPVSQDFKELVAGETGESTGAATGSGQSNNDEDSAGVQELIARELETKAPAQRLDKKQSSRRAGINYVKQNFFYQKPAQSNSQTAEDLEIEKIQNKRRKLIRDIILDALTYSQVYKEKGKADFQSRLQAVKNAQNEVKTETEAIATTTMALKNILQETMLQVTLEQKLFRLEAAQNLQVQNIQMEE